MRLIRIFVGLVAAGLCLTGHCGSNEMNAQAPASLEAKTVNREPAKRDLAVMQVNVHEYLLRGYRQGRANTREIVKSAFAVGKKLDLDPLLILAVAAIESGLNPHARSGAGAEGVMQVHVPSHAGSFIEDGKRKSTFDTAHNIEVGAQILKDYISRTGSVHEALKWYVGARFLKSDKGYARRVLVEMSRLDYAADGEVLDARKRLRLKEPAPFFEKTYPRRILPYIGVYEAKTRFALRADSKK